MSKSELEEEFYRWVIREGWRPKREYRFHPFRRWRFDFAWPRKKIGVEIHGGVYARRGAKKCPLCYQIPGGRHSTGAGLEGDSEKYTEAAVCGWRIIHITEKRLRKDKDKIKEWLEKLIGRRSKKNG